MHESRPKTNKRSEVEARDKGHQDRMKKQFDKVHGARELRELSPGRNVVVEDVGKQGTIVRQREERRSYDVELNNGARLRRNRKTLCWLPTRRVIFYGGNELSFVPAFDNGKLKSKPSTPESSPRKSSGQSTMCLPFVSSSPRLSDPSPAVKIKRNPQSL